MPTGGKGLSVVIAGATGSTGREIVSSLVMHPKVDRVVALSRSPIPADRWPAVFPKLRVQDALKHLSIVPVDWDRLHRDSSQIPFSYLCKGQVFSDIDEMASETGFGSGGFSSQGSSGGGGGVVSGHGGQGSMDGFFFQSSTREDFDPTPQPTDSGTATSGGGSDDDADALLLTDKQRYQFTRELLANPFYKSVFSGHHVAINCLGTHNLFITADVTTVDKLYSVAFAKLVRVFNCRQSEAEDALMQARDLSRMEEGSEMWKEVRAACFGKDAGLSSTICKKSGESPASGMTADGPDGSATLRHFVQLSTAGASERSPFPYFTAHGEADNLLLEMYNRRVHKATHSSSPSSSSTSSHHHSHGEPTGKSPTEKEAKVFLDNSRITIWRPGLLHRSADARLAEKMLSLVVPRVCVTQLASLMVSDIISSMNDERDVHEVGPVRIIGPSNISVWTRMAARAAEKEAAASKDVPSSTRATATQSTG